MRRTVEAFVVLLFTTFASVYGQEYCVPEDGQYPPEADVTLTIGSPCDSSEIVGIPIYLDNPCPVGGFEMEIVLTDPNLGVYFDETNPDVADLIGSRNTEWGFFSFNVNNPTTITVLAIGPGGSQPSLPPGTGLLFTVHPSLEGTVDNCQMVRFGAIDHVFDESGYVEYGRIHEQGTLCIGCEPSWRRGDANRSGTLNIADVITLFNHLRGSPICFGGCICTGDFNNSGSINISDVIDMFTYLKGQGEQPVPCN
ncbi:MAG: hypothetical protein V3W18_07250 [candidate division Zixibacteria bacterium]